MNDRDRLIEIMVHASAAWRWGDVETAERWRQHDREMIGAALAAAEAAGYEIRKVSP